MSLEGRTLGRWDDKATLQQMSSDTNVKAVCNTLDQFHDKGYIHGDAHIGNFVHASSPPATTGAGKYVLIDLERCHKLSDMKVDASFYDALKFVDLMHLMRQLFHNSVFQVFINDKGVREKHQSIFRNFYEQFQPLYSSNKNHFPPELKTLCTELFNDDVIKSEFAFKDDTIHDTAQADSIARWFCECDRNIENIIHCPCFSVFGDDAKTLHPFLKFLSYACL